MTGSEVPRPDAKVPSPAVLRAVRILEVLAQRKVPVTLTEVARITGLAKSSVSDVLVTLGIAGMARDTGNGWVLGYRVLELGQSALASTDLVSEFRRLTLRMPALRAETVLLGVLDGLDVLYVARHNGNQPIRLGADIGRRLPAVVTALGKAMLAALSDAELRARLASLTQLPRLTPRSHVSRSELRADLMEVRRFGYAVDDQQNTRGVVCYGAAITGYRQPTAVSTTLLASRVTPELQARLTSDIRGLARQLSGVAGR